MQNKGLTFIVFIHYRTWFRYTRRPHFAPLAKFGKLYIIESPLVLFSKEFLSSIFSSLKQYFKYSFGFRKDERSGAEVFRPLLFFPSSIKNKNRFFNKIDTGLLKFQLQKIYKNPGFKINFITNRSNKWLINKNANNFWILDINDDWSLMGYDKSEEDKIKDEVKELIKRIDLATVVTKKLTRKFNFENKAVFVPNAVDVNHYKPSFDHEFEKVEEENIREKFNDLSILRKEKDDPRLYLTSLDPMDKMKKPIVGSYSGLSGNWSDFAFIEKVEKLLPKEFTMVSSGNIHPPTFPAYIEEYKSYMKNQRMIYLGYVDYSILPEFLSKLDVALVMHRMDEFNTHSAPNKIWAYLAMGLPVVSTDFLTEPDKEIYEGLVNFAKTPEEYVKYIIEEFQSDNPEKKRKRRELAVRYSADNRASKLVDIIRKKVLPQSH